MAKIAVEENNLYNIADAIREKNGTGDLYKVSQMASAIRQIKGADVRYKFISENGTYSAPEGVDGFNPVVVSIPDITSDATLSSGAQILSGVTAYASGSKYTGTIPMYNGSINSGSGSVPSYDYYDGSYVITPSTVSQAFPTAGKIMSKNLQVESYSAISAETYSGSYTLVPSVISQAFPTAGKLMSQDLVLESYFIDYYSGSYMVSPSTDAILLSVSGKTFSEDLQINAFDLSAQVYNGSYVIDPSIALQTIPVSGKKMLEDLTINPYEPQEMSDVTISDNGVYFASAFGVDGFSKVTVSVSQIAYTNIEPYEYAGDNTISVADFPTAINIGEYGFSGCYNMSAISFPVALNIGTYAFCDCSSIVSASFPLCGNIEEKAFLYCMSLATISFPQCRTIGSFAFWGCSNLTSVSLPLCEMIYENAFSDCRALSSVYLPNCTIINSYAFYSTINIKTINLPKCEYLGDAAFFYDRIEEARFGNLRYMGWGGLSLEASAKVYLSGSYVCDLHPSESFWGDEEFYVPSSLYNQYIAHSVWSRYASQIYSM